MRFGLWAATAAALLCAGQASAARYIEFQVKGGANTASGAFIGSQNYTSTDTFAFDLSTLPTTPMPQNPYAYYLFSGGTTGGGNFAIPTSFDIIFEADPNSSMASVTSMPLPAGPAFSFSFDLSKVPVSDVLQQLQIANSSYYYRAEIDSRHATTVDTMPGQIASVFARETNTAPASLQAVESLIVTAVPEPTSWLVMILGFGGIGALLRRKSKPATTLAIG